MTVEIPLSRPTLGEDELRELERVLSSGWVSQGPKVREFEEAVARYTGARHAIAVINCTAALHLSLLGLGIRPGDEVIVADFTFPATGHAVLYCGATPVFVDVDPRTYNIDPAAIEPEITAKTRGIIPVHAFGQPAEMDAILDLASEYNLFVLEDAACALGARYRGVQAGTIGDIGCYSFHARKGITTGEGGMIVTNRDDLAETVRHLSVFGMRTAWDREGGGVFSIPVFTDLGYNYKMSDITAAIGVAQMRRIDEFIERRRSLAAYLDTRLTELDAITAPYIHPDAASCYQSYVTLVDGHINRNCLIERLMAGGIQTQIGTYASHIQPIYGSKHACPRSLDVYNRSLALPMYGSLTLREIDVVLEALEENLQ